MSNVLLNARRFGTTDGPFEQLEVGKEGLPPLFVAQEVVRGCEIT